jgi:hypothetical protein
MAGDYTAQHKDFERVWLNAHARSISTQAFATELGITVRRVFARRSAVESALGIKLPALGERKPSSVARGYDPERDRVEIESDLPDDDIDVDQLVAHRINQYGRKKAAHEARKLINVRVPVTGPYGIFVFGDPHVDDDGTDLAQLKHDAELVRNTEGLYGVSIGDNTNNWIGRLARLYGEQGTTAKQAWKLCEWFVNLVGPKWLALIPGNHDCWSGAGDPLQWMSRNVGALYGPHKVRLAMQSTGGRTLHFQARHDFPGHSMWNTAHGVGRAAQRGETDEILICGHKHVSGYMLIKQSSERLSHCVQVASYKVLDRYAEEKGFEDRHISPGVMFVIDPQAENEAGFVTTFFDTDRGVEFLKFLRSARS